MSLLTVTVFGFISAILLPDTLISSTLNESIIQQVETMQVITLESDEAVIRKVT